MTKLNMGDLDTIFERHKINKDAQKDIKKVLENLVLKTFFSIVDNPTPNSTNSKTTTPPTNTGNTGNTGNVCRGKKVNGSPCTLKAKDNGFCGRHDPDKMDAEPKLPKKNAKKISTKSICEGIIKKTNQQCTQSGSVEINGKHFCKRHSEQSNEE